MQKKRNHFRFPIACSVLMLEVSRTLMCGTYVESVVTLMKASSTILIAIGIVASLPMQFITMGDKTTF